MGLFEVPLPIIKKSMTKHACLYLSPHAGREQDRFINEWREIVWVMDQQSKPGMVGQHLHAGFVPVCAQTQLQSILGTSSRDLVHWLLLKKTGIRACKRQWAADPHIGVRIFKLRYIGSFQPM